MIWQPPEGRYRALINAWKNGEPRLRLIAMWINSAPILLFPLGERKYYELSNRFGDNTWYSPTNLYRESFHLSGGCLLCLPFIKSPFISCIVSAAIFILALMKELFFDAKESPLDFKNFLDAFCWFLGSAIVVCISFWIRS